MKCLVLILYSLSLHIYIYTSVILVMVWVARFKGNVEGGETLVADVVPVLEELREKYPKQFDILCTLPASFQRQTVLR